MKIPVISDESKVLHTQERQRGGRKLQLSARFKNAGESLKRTGKQMRKNYAAYLFLLPKLILFTLFIAIPVVWAFLLSFQKYQIIEANTFAGIDNYLKVFQSEAFRQALLNTTIYTVVKIGRASCRERVKIVAAV